MKLFGAFLVVLVPSVALADGDKKMRVVEIQLGGTVHTDSQFVELADPGEEFPESYMFVVYDDKGGKVGAQSMPLSRGTTRVVMANQSAQDEYKLKVGTRDSVAIMNLQNTLPNAGAVCFRRQDGGKPASTAGDESGTRIHCVGWGNTSQLPVSLGGTEHADAPPPGLSLQKLNGCWQVDPATPNAPSPQACQVRSDKPLPMPAAAPADAGVEIDAAAEPDDEPAPTANTPPSAEPPPTAAPPPVADAAPYQGKHVPENGVVGGTKEHKGSCSASGDASWFGIVSIAGLAITARRRRQRAASDICV